ncbi:MAG: hypothetical protein G01um1014106_343 [Parcubacteria group bacterium Gr01-1014_106]|nr:MAG: hypothetical protein G01um1014106_343 [Parcubacteria group bacterium Gr01-1014_106]
MVNKEQIDQWLREGTITPEQASKMLVDAREYKKEQSSNKLIVAVSTIGAILLGIGAILFVASNWEVIPDTLKVLLLAGSTFAMYSLGYLFKYQMQNFPKVGSSLIFLGALLFGATVFLIAQIYHVNAYSHVLVLVWLFGVLPFAYAFSSPTIAALSALLLYLWIGLFVFQGVEFFRAAEDFTALPLLYLVSAVLLFGLGTAHYLFEQLRSVARIYRLISLGVGMAALFLLTFHTFYPSLNISWQFTVGFVICAFLAAAFAVISLIFNPSKSNTNLLESIFGVGLAFFALLVFIFPPDELSVLGDLYVVVMNLLLLGAILSILFIGYQREDIHLVNMGMFWFSVFVIVRYFDFFWELLPRSLFFMTGGLVLVLGGIALERKRRQLRAQFTASSSTATVAHT